MRTLLWMVRKPVCTEGEPETLASIWTPSKRGIVISFVMKEIGASRLAHDHDGAMALTSLATRKVSTVVEFGVRIQRRSFCNCSCQRPATYVSLHELLNASARPYIAARRSVFMLNEREE